MPNALITGQHGTYSPQVLLSNGFAVYGVLRRPTSANIIGEYIGKIYLETKRRPRFHLREMLD